MIVTLDLSPDVVRRLNEVRVNEGHSFERQIVDAYEGYYNAVEEARQHSRRRRVRAAVEAHFGRRSGAAR